MPLLFLCITSRLPELSMAPLGINWKEMRLLFLNLGRMIAPHRVYKLPIRDARSWTSPMGCSKGAPQHISLSLDTSLSTSHSLHLSFTSPRMASRYISRYIFHSINYNSDLSHLVATNPICVSKQKSKG